MHVSKWRGRGGHLWYVLSTQFTCEIKPVLNYKLSIQIFKTIELLKNTLEKTELLLVSQKPLNHLQNYPTSKIFTVLFCFCIGILKWILRLFYSELVWEKIRKDWDLKCEC